MAKTRRSHAEVVNEALTNLKALEAEKAALEKEKAKAGNPISLLLVIKIAILSRAIARIVKQIRKWVKGK